MTHIASIEMGSHTARLLVASKPGPDGKFYSLVRKRETIRLAEGYDERGGRTLRPEHDAADSILLYQDPNVRL